MSGRMPKRGGSEIGYQFLPKRKPVKLSVWKSARPSLSKKKKISTTKMIEAIPERKIARSIRNSKALFT